MIAHRILRSSALIGVFYLISRLVGLFRDRILSGHFGASPMLDAYYAAFSIPDFIFNLVIAGAVTSAFIPIFIQEESKDSDSAWRLASSTLFAAVMLVTFLCILAAIFMPWIIRGIAPGFDDSVTDLAVTLSRFMLFSPIIFAFSSIFGGLLQSFNRFFLFSLAPIFYNLGIIFGALVLVPQFGPLGLAEGVVIGALAHAITQALGLRGIGAKISLKSFDLKNQLLKKVAVLSFPRALVLAADQINWLLVAALSSTVSAGALAIFNLANNFRFLPISLVGISFAVASFPTLSRLAADNKEEFGKKITDSLRGILFVVIPATVLLIQFSDELIQLILRTGVFTMQDAFLTSRTLQWLAVGVIAESLIPYLARSFYAMNNTWIPAVGGVIGLAVNIILAVILIGMMGLSGLAIAFSVAAIVKCIWLLDMLAIKVNSFGLGSTLKLGSLMLLLSLVLFLVFRSMNLNLSPIYLLIISGGGQALLYLFLSYILKVKEMRLLFRRG